ncbi:MAG TPA: MBL fold metallo-hydrolase [Pyrinomonadaceae bacterium]|nr:MBL fold metallo-hydrolase [Pyrinomonadaceae bacterium]
MMIRLAVFVFILAFAVNDMAASPYVVVLGVGQDAGVPQMGCDSPFCKQAWSDDRLRQTVSSIALVDPDTKSRWIIDATPDLPEQFEFLKQITGDRTNDITGLFLTHAHIGHYTGLMYLGRESMNGKDVKVYAMPRMKQMLEQNAPWSQLVGLKNISLQPLVDKSEVRLNDRLTVEPFLVPHRDEFSETVGYRIRSRTKTLIFIPDIDKWQKWQTPLADVVRTADYLLIDGTFYADGEISRPMSEVPHPFVSETVDLLKALPVKERAKVYFTHFNHSNPLVQGNKTALQDLRRHGFRMAKSGLRLRL